MTSVKIGALGVIAIAILIAVVGVLIAYWLNGLKTKYCYAKQIVLGIAKLILPLILVYVIFTGLYNKLNAIDINVLINSIGEIKEALLVIIICETLAILVNPLPKWCFENNVEGISDIAKKIIKEAK